MRAPPITTSPRRERWQPTPRYGKYWSACSKPKECTVHRRQIVDNGRTLQRDARPHLLQKGGGLRRDGNGGSCHDGRCRVSAGTFRSDCLRKCPINLEEEPHNTYSNAVVKPNRVKSLGSAVSRSTRSDRKHLYALLWGRITFSRSVTIISRATGLGHMLCRCSLLLR